MLTLGISAFYHNSACCLFKDGDLLSALQEERFSRHKGTAEFPIKSIRSMLQQFDLTINDIDLICYYENTKLKLARQMEMNLTNDQFALALLKRQLVEDSIRNHLGYKKEIFYSLHHHSHVGNGIFQSGWKEAAYLCVDSVGEKNCFSWGEYNHKGLTVHGQINFPHSMGALYSTVTSFLGFSVNDEEFKLMGLAAHGNPELVEKLSRNLLTGHGKDFALNSKYFSFFTEFQEKMYTTELEALFGMGPRKSNDPILPIHKDIAASIQKLLENELKQLIEDVFPKKVERLIFCGGVAHNSLANHHLSQLPQIGELFIPAAPNDVGSSIGACIIARLQKGMGPTTLNKREIPYWGLTENNPEDLGDLNTLIKPIDLEFICKTLLKGEVVAVCRGKMEFGDRALGNRSILANPDFKNIKNIINTKIKRREEFRPFAPIVTWEKAREYFEIQEENKLMSKIYKLKNNYLSKFLGIQNNDGTARVQTLTQEDNPFIYQVLTAFGELSGFEMLLNTSLNLNGEPIAMNGPDAVDIFLRSNIDLLILDQGMLRRSDVPSSFLHHYQEKVRPIKDAHIKTTYEFL